MSDLRKALLADHAFRYDIGAEQRADRAVAIVAAWLRDEAEFIETEHADEALDHRTEIIEHLRWLADSVVETEGAS